MEDGKKDGGPVAGTGGGKFGPPMRWTRPKAAHPDVEMYSTTVLVWGVGASIYRRRSISLDMLVQHASIDGFRAYWYWATMANGGVRTIARRSDQAESLAEAKAAALTAAHEIVSEAEKCPLESAHHPPMGPAVWPGKR